MNAVGMVVVMRMVSATWCARGLALVAAMSAGCSRTPFHDADGASGDAAGVGDPASVGGDNAAGAGDPASGGGEPVWGGGDSAAGGDDAVRAGDSVPLCVGGCDVATGFNFPFAMTLLGDTIYVAEFSGGGIWAVTPGGTAPPTRLYDAGDEVYAIDTDGVNLYWGTVGGIFRAPIVDGPVMVFWPGLAVKDLMLADGWLYWTTTANTGGVFRASSASGDQQTLLPDEPFNNLYVAGGSVFLSRYSGDGIIGTIPVTGGSLNTIATTQNGPWGIRVDNTFVYWVNHEAGELVRVSLIGGQTQVLGTGSAGFHELVLANSSIYVASDTSGELYSFDAASGLSVLADNLGSPRHLVAHEGFVYFTDSKNNRIARVPW